MSVGVPDTGGELFPPVADDLGDGMAEDLRARVKAELEPGERLIWAARSSPPPPPMAAYFVWTAIALFLFMIGTVMIAIAQSRSRWFERDNPTPLGVMMDIVSLPILAGVIAGWISKRSAWLRQANACYAITDRRAISWIPEPGEDGIRVHSLPRGQIRDVTRVERLDGSGSLEFALAQESPDFYLSHHVFKFIPQVRRVEQIVRHNLTAPQKTA